MCQETLVSVEWKLPHQCDSVWSDVERISTLTPSSIPCVCVHVDECVVDMEGCGWKRLGRGSGGTRVCPRVEVGISEKNQKLIQSIKLDFDTDTPTDTLTARKPS